VNGLMKGKKAGWDIGNSGIGNRGTEDGTDRERKGHRDS
jgi:hypothetical protein